MSRNKENIPLTSAQRPSGSLLVPSKHLSSDEFFTDSLLDATRLSSQIPTPSPQKPSLTKARRARSHRNARGTQNPSHKPSASDVVAVKSRNKSAQPTTPLRNGTGAARLRTSSLTTPPESKDDLPFPSPYFSISSPPPQDLTNTYRQIEDEEDLAQTEREVSSDEGNRSETSEPHPIRLTQRSFSESPLKAPLAFTLTSRASTPTRSLSNNNRDKRLSERTETMSEPSGMSFMNEMTDQDLAAKLTPHMSESAKDKLRLKQVWKNQQKLTAFSRADLPNRNELRNDSYIPVPKVIAFSKATKPPPNSIFQDIQRNAHHDQPGLPASGPESIASSNETRQTGSRALKVMPTNTRIVRDFPFTHNHGFPPHRPALTEKNLEQQNRGSPNANTPLRSQSSVPSLRSDRSNNNARVLDEGNHVTHGRATRLPQLRRSVQAKSEDPSPIDWAAAAADVPVPSIETSLDSEKKDATPMSSSKVYTPDKLRRWDNDFTGQSFQVSESPPVRQQSALREEKRLREIEGLAKQAVTTSRLSEIRERQSRESLRSFSRSPAPRSLSRPAESSAREAAAEATDPDAVAEPLSNTPVVIYRSSSVSASENPTGKIALQRPGIDRSKSHDHMQRLARAMSLTPRSSPASETQLKDVKDDIVPPVDVKESEQVRLEHVGAEIPAKTSESTHAVIAQTPRVTGAWVDTILPETVRTVKQIGQSSGYAQTPHVSAGGWIDTPAPVGPNKSSEAIPTIIEEVPEELMSGIAKDTASNDTVKVEVPSDLKAPTLPEAEPLSTESRIEQQPRSALASILDKQKARLVSQDITSATREDTLNLGNDTIESFQDLLALDENDLTTLSRLSALSNDTKPLGEVEAERALIDRLGIKLDRLRNNIEDARKGISKIEREVSQPQQQMLITTPQQLLNETICPICNQQTFQPHNHAEPEPKLFPHTSQTFSLPIPLLFHPRKRGQLFPRPTLLGYTTFAIWLWYLIECTMCELYCRPAYTDFYAWPSEPEPEFPFVLPTMLARWTRVNQLALGSFTMWFWNASTRLIRAVWRIINMALGWSDGFVADSASPAASIVKKVLETVTDVVAPGATGLSMNDDEYI